MDFIGQVWSGKAGLARTYWLFGVIAGIAWGIPLSLVTPGSPLAMSVVGLFVAYFVIVYVGVWRAASQYEGPKVWAVLAKAAVAALPALLIVGTIMAFVLPSEAKKTTYTYDELAPPGQLGTRYYTDEEVGIQPKQEIDSEWWKKGTTPVTESNGQAAQPQGLKPFNGKLDGE